MEERLSTDECLKIMGFYNSSARNDVFKKSGKQQVQVATGFFCLWDPCF